MKLRFLYFSITLLFTNTAPAQNGSLVPCNITMKNGSVLSGYIRVDKSRFTPTQFEFYRENNIAGKQELITPLNAKLVEIADSLVYHSGTVKIYKNPVGKNVLGEDSDEPVQEGTFFIALLIKGSRVSLYALEDSIKTHFIIGDSDDSLQSLRYVRYYDNSDGVSFIKEETYYKNQLLAYIDIDNDVVRKKILGTRFNRKELIGAIMSINNSNQLSQSASEEIQERRVLYPFIEAGGGLLSITFSGINPNLSTMNFSPVFVAKFTAGVELHFDKKEKLFTDTYISIYPYSFSASHTRTNSAGTSVVDTYELKAIPVTVGVLINYTILTIKKVKVTVGAGYMLVINKILRNNLTTTDKNPNGSFVILSQPKITRTVGQYSFDMDVFLNNRVSIRLAYLPRQDFSGLNFNSFKNKMISSGVKFRL